MVANSRNPDESQNERLDRLENERRVGFADRVLSQTNEQREQSIEMEVQRRVADSVRDVPAMLNAAVERAVRDRARETAEALETVARKLVADTLFMDQIARHLQDHRRRTAAQWLGERMWHIAITAGIGALLAWRTFFEGRVK